MKFPSFSDFKRLANKGNLVPLVMNLSADTETPVSAYLKLTQGPHRFLFESMEGGQAWGRYSFLGSEPSLILESQGEQIRLIRGKKIETLQGDPLEFIQSMLAKYHPVAVEGLPRFSGGWVGYLSYDMVRFMERLPSVIAQASPFPDARLMLQDSVIAFDNLEQKLSFIVQVHLDHHLSLAKQYERGKARLAQMVKRLKRSRPAVPPVTKQTLRLTANTTKAQYIENVRCAQEYIRAGDIFQVVLSLRMEGKQRVDPFQVYRRLRQINPSPYLFCLQMGEDALAGSSPEVMVRLEGRQMTVRPIAGTRRRGKTLEHDLAMEQEMLADPKERAEHIMLVDLARNDLGRVAETGSVKVTRQMMVERYSHVMHLVSNVEGVVRKEMNAMDVLKATFPAGTLTGAPKIRAMEIIESLEKDRRGPYGGCVGYFDFFGNMDMAITIRTLAFHKNRILAQSGAGIVLDSIPEREYLECENKAKVMMEALKR